MKDRFSLLRTFYFGLVGKMSYYAVAKGRNPGIYQSWDACKSEVNQFSGAVYKKFSSAAEAQSFIAERSGSSGYGKQKSYSSSGYSSRKSSTPYSRPVARSYSSSSSSSESSSYSSNGFKTDNDGRVDIYTDGACSSNGSSQAKAGIGVYFGDNHPANISRPVQGRITNNSAEIEAVIEAANAAKRNGINKIRINTDSQFLINCKTKWMPRWKASGWVTAKKQPVSNREELQKMDKALSELDVEFNHVRGHQGVYGNEQADKLARAGAKQFK